jgi:soluble lytic murein transglycosylase-like protein
MLAAVAGLLLLAAVVTHMNATSREYAKGLLRAAAKRWGINPEWLIAIGWVESRLLSTALNLVGADGARGGAHGLLQITLKTAQMHGFKGTAEQLRDPQINADWGARIMAAGSPKSIQDAAAWWNAGRKTLGELGPTHVTRTTYVPKVVAALAQVQKGAV